MIYTSSLYRKIRETGAHVVGFIDDITIYKGGKDIDKNTRWKSSLYVASRNEWQSDYDTPDEINHYYFIVKRELYGGKYPKIPLKSFISSVSRHTFSKLFQLRKGHGGSGKVFPD